MKSGVKVVETEYGLQIMLVYLKHNQCLAFVVVAPSDLSTLI